ncbi:hypothetical protein SCLCIDRAFT_1130835 [Scleroderma citrinum Foug A]|uniref:Uncharacterized protein n=1 Tax=Scleroderma citrinum Foug A TaxID=1036808 RepID=A0A0C3DNR9_9AGAM|nr:hypothetical protein SCLCIDRAFT_1130835 [Scleroderma citrinum Foug A]
MAGIEIGRSKYNSSLVTRLVKLNDHGSAIFGTASQTTTTVPCAPTVGTRSKPWTTSYLNG